MPFDSLPQETMPDISSLPLLDPRRIIAWAETTPTDEAYCYESNGDCLMHRYLRAQGVDMPNGFGVSGFYYQTKRGEERHFPLGLARALAASPRTYGAFVERARKLMASGVP